MDKKKQNRKHYEKVKKHFITTINSELLKQKFSFQRKSLYNLPFVQLDISELYIVFCEDNRVMFTEVSSFSRENNHKAYGNIEVCYYYLKNVFNSKNIFGNIGWINSSLPWNNEKEFRINDVKSIAVRADRIIPLRLLSQKEKISKNSLKEIQIFINDYLIEHPGYIEILFKKENYKKVYKR